MLEIQEVNVKRGQTQVLNRVCLKLEPHTMTVIIGRNGCGKSTLVSCINQMLPYEGKILVSGRDLAQLKPRERARQISTLPQVLAVPHITVEELVQLGRSPYVDIGRHLTQTDQKAVDRAVAAVGLEGLLHCYTDEISGGERQKAYLAMALAQDTELMVFDEPTTYMDMAYENTFLELLDTLKLHYNKTLLVVMHNLNQAICHADHLAVLDGGRFAFDGSREECLASDVIERVFGVRRYEADGRIFFG